VYVCIYDLDSMCECLLVTSSQVTYGVCVFVCLCVCVRERECVYVCIYDFDSICGCL